MVEEVAKKGQVGLVKHLLLVPVQIYRVVNSPVKKLIGFVGKSRRHGAWSSPALILQLWATSTQTPNDGSDLLEGIEHQYE